MTETIQTELFNGAARPVQAEENVVHTNCALCGRGLTDAKSIKRGIGPKCWKRASATTNVSGG